MHRERREGMEGYQNKEPILFVSEVEEDKLLSCTVENIAYVPKIRKQAEEALASFTKKCDELQIKGMDGEIKKLQSILDELQHLKVTVRFLNH
jgi:hypothetical protein